MNDPIKHNVYDRLRRVLIDAIMHDELSEAEADELSRIAVHVHAARALQLARQAQQNEG